MQKKISFFTILFFTLFVNAQTKVSGVIYDDQNLPLPFANIYFKGNKTGISSDINGVFSIESANDYKTIIIKYAGFEDKEVELNTSIINNLKVVMSTTKQLKEVIVVAKPKKHLKKEENPAYRILQQIWKNKKKNGLVSSKSYQYTKYTSVANGLSNLDSIFLKRVLGSHYDSVIKIAEQKRNQTNYIIPTYLKETNEKIYGNNINNKYKEVVEGERTTGLADKGFMMEKIGNFIKPFDVYDDDVVILNKVFMSPLSTRGYSQYEYVLKDSIQEGNKKIYEIFYFPRNNQDLLFQGSFKVSDKNFAITEIYLRNNPKVNLNFVRNLSIEKIYTIQDNDVYLPERETYEGDFTFFSKEDGEKGMYLKKNILYSDYIFNQELAPNFYDQVEVQTLANQFEKEDNYWKQLTTREAGINNTRKIITDLGNNKRIRRVTNLITILTSGYFTVFKNIQYGSLYQTFSNNNIEGLRLKAGFRTFTNPNDMFRVNGYMAYGSMDHATKFGLSTRYLINSSPRITLGLGFLKDNLQLSGIGLEESELIATGPSTNVIIARGENYSLTNVEKSVFSTDYQPHNNLKFNLSFVHRYMKSASENRFSLAYNYNGEIKNTLTDFAISCGVFYTPKRDVYGFGVDQTYTGRLYSTFALKYTHGLKGVFNGQYNYDKVQLLYEKPLQLSNFGVLRTTLEGAKVFQKLPLNLLTPIVVNQAYSISPNSFSLLDYYDLVTDQYLSIRFEHHFNGYIFNRIPLLKKLKLREVLFYKTVWGSISQSNKTINHSSINYNAPTNAYSEYGFGIENIGLGNFKPIRIDCIWRSAFTDINGSIPPTFGVRFGFFPEF
ncbi:carboxypeptidase-like regulatory domain-containing protein [Flavobacterium columnare]|uniref:Carboxypeptidase-like regulatory domain-containing protein n=2 Tax=Flavobacterium columnare TaxID=996 RepID=G8X6S0_FLACA|nr:DUF5686 family protein [Flavobacterium columnare]AEW85655.1 hypothetical protein FCOL_04105 [Flavobacterium columnare ATCC 49512]AMO20882.1 carboxypeptidase-like regulatory domain-containing protein [Flavobacterium columnare]ANO47410.1 hypothetical protein Pf1_01955 [Flavobacterium columnare]APT21938.1 hypothetical protein BU993_04365 [Flavobacterium columnare]AUX18874.1 hypothetical protein AQ623_11770 [Flavobacterium columnare]